jgi:hypothetical protein
MKNFLHKIYFFLPLFLVSHVYANDDPPRFEGRIRPIVENVHKYLFPLAGLIALIFIIQGGYMWMISGGDPNKVKQAQGTLTWAVLGLIVVMVIFSLLRVLINFLS